MVKVKKLKEARGIIMPLLEEHPRNVELLGLGALVSLEAGRTREADELIERFEAEAGEGDLRVKELKARLLVKQGKLNEALGVYDQLLKDDPDNWDYQVDQADVLVRLRMWRQAKGAYSSILGDDMRRKEILWDTREVYKEGSHSIDFDFEYLHGPNSLRQYRLAEGATAWISQNFRMTAQAFEEIHVRPASGSDFTKINEFVPGHRLGGEWFINEMFALSGYWETAYLGGEGYYEFGGKVQIEKGPFRSQTTYSFDHLVRDPVEGLEKEGRTDQLATVNEVMLFDRILVGHLFEVDWYRVSSDGNQINGKKYLGHKITNDVYTNITILPAAPYLSVNFHYRYGHWDKSFERANEVLDFIEDEQIYYGGLYLRERIGEMIEVAGSITRTYDHKREFYSTISTYAIDVWLRDNVLASIYYEYDRGSQGTLGEGDVQTLRGKVKVMF